MVSQTVGREPLICHEIDLDSSQPAYFYQNRVDENRKSKCITHSKDKYYLRKHMFQLYI